MSGASKNKLKKTGLREPMVAITLRLPKTLVAEFDGRAAGALTRSDLMRAALENGVGRLPTPRVVPEVNREQVMEMRVLAEDLHKLIRMIELARSTALVEALSVAASSSAALVDLLRNMKSGWARDEAVRVKEARDEALASATRLNQAVHEQFGPHMSADADTLDRLYDRVRRLQGVCMWVQQALIGK